MKNLHSVFSKNKVVLRNIKRVFFTALFVSATFYSFSRELVCNSNQVKLVTFSSAPKPLAYELLSFRAEFKANSTVVLNWITESEKSTSHYVMQRSIDGHIFNDAALLFTKEGDRNKKMEYSYIDHINEMKSKLVYYRLKIVDASGKATYSEAVIVRKKIPVYIANTSGLSNEIACR